MDLANVLKQAKTPRSWHRYQDSDAEFFISEISTKDYQRLSGQCVKNGKYDATKMIEKAYPKIIHDWRGVTPKFISEYLGLSVEELTDPEGNPLPPDQEIPFDINAAVQLGLVKNEFNSFIEDNAKLNPRAVATRLADDEDEKKTS